MVVTELTGRLQLVPTELIWRQGSDSFCSADTGGAESFCESLNHICMS